MVPAEIPPQPLELSETHLERLRLLSQQGFELTRFPFFDAHIGVKKYGCAALLQPLPQGRWQIAASPTYVVEGHLSALVERGGEAWFVWKSYQVRATPERLEALRRFEQELRALLEPPAKI
ncbi:MAG TPA: hypothetical protein VJ085_07250 [Candidatus Acidoferrales bacterium]|nr:hypothetical protein [Candidatus Acidoferrales bacterium]